MQIHKEKKICTFPFSNVEACVIFSNFHFLNIMRVDIVSEIGQVIVLGVLFSMGFEMFTVSC